MTRIKRPTYLSRPAKIRTSNFYGWTSSGACLVGETIPGTSILYSSVAWHALDGALLEGIGSIGSQTGKDVGECTFYVLYSHGRI
jgi:hypothetical protein